MMYRVSINGLDFDIEDGHTALSFAELARAKFVPSKHIPNPDVTIRVTCKDKEVETNE